MVTAVPRPAVRSIGIDTGPVTGIFEATWLPGRKKAYRARAYQCDAASAPGLLAFILSLPADAECPCTRPGGIEEIRDGKVKGAGLAVARRLVVTLSAIAAEHGVILAARPAATVKLWATGRRLEAAGLAETLGKMTDDAADAARQCVYCAVRDGGMPDPLSRTVTAG